VSEGEEVSLTLPWRVNNWFPSLDPSTLNTLKALFSELQKYHLSLNLVSPRSMPVADVVHFADSILGSQSIYKNGKVQDEIYDFGSGNGFPGLVFAILYPQIVVKLVDIDSRKCEYLKAVSHKLGLRNVQVLNIQADKLPSGSVKFGMSRGFANISKSVLMLRRVFAPQGVYFHFKSEEWPKEVAEMPTALCSYWSPELLSDYRLPVGEVKFSIVKTIRTSKID
jgi:16S rRNA (guanine527-N7)-methyltransferase